MKAYTKGDIRTYFNELLRIETDKDDKTALEWVRRLYGSGQAEGLYHIKEEHRKPTAGFLNLNVLRSESGEAAYRHSIIWKVAGNEDEYLRWLEMAAVKGYVIGDGPIRGRYAKSVYATAVLRRGVGSVAVSWMEKAIADGDLEAERLVIAADLEMISDPDFVKSWPRSPERGAMLLERRAKRNLSDLYVNDQTRCNATLDLVDLHLGVGGLPPRNVDFALKLAEEALQINDCYKRAASRISVAIGMGGGTYNPIEREKMRKDWQARSFQQSGNTVP